MLFPLPSAWNMVKDSPNHIPENIIGYAHLPREIHEDGYVPILLEVLITPTPEGPSTEVYPDLRWYHIIHHLHGGYYNLYMFYFSEHAIMPPMMIGI